MSNGSLHKDNKGMTMVEIMVGFVILTLIMTGVYQLIKFGSNMFYESSDVRNGQTEFESELYKISPDAGVAKREDEKTLGSGTYVLEPVSESAKRPGVDAECTDTTIRLFSGGGKELYSYNYPEGASYSDHFGIKVYGIE